MVVEILDNDIAEGNSVFSVYLSLPDLANMREGENTTVAVTILDDESGQCCQWQCTVRWCAEHG